MKQSNRVIALVLFCVFAFGLAVPAFAVDSVNVPTVTAVNCASEITIGYKETRQFEFEAHDLPAGAAVHVFCSGEDRGETLSGRGLGDKSGKVLGCQHCYGLGQPRIDEPVTACVIEVDALTP